MELVVPEDNIALESDRLAFRNISPIRKSREESLKARFFCEDEEDEEEEKSSPYFQKPSYKEETVLIEPTDEFVNLQLTTDSQFSHRQSLTAFKEANSMKSSMGKSCVLRQSRQTYDSGYSPLQSSRQANRISALSPQPLDLVNNFSDESYRQSMLVRPQTSRGSPASRRASKTKREGHLSPRRPGKFKRFISWIEGKICSNPRPRTTPQQAERLKEQKNIKR